MYDIPELHPRDAQPCYEACSVPQGSPDENLKAKTSKGTYATEETSTD